MPSSLRITGDRFRAGRGSHDLIWSRVRRTLLLVCLAGLVGYLSALTVGCQSGEPFEVALNPEFDLTTTRPDARPPSSASPGSDPETVDWRVSPGWVVEKATGTRDGARTHVRIQARLDDHAVSLDMEIEVDPQPRLNSGRWLFRGARGPKGTGVIRASNLRFLGGQAGWPSLGGDFILEDSRGFPYVRIRVDSLELPPTPRPTSP